MGQLCWGVAAQYMGNVGGGGGGRAWVSWSAIYSGRKIFCLEGQSHSKTSMYLHTHVHTCMYTAIHMHM